MRLNIPSAYIRYNTLVGDGAHTRNQKQQLLKERMQLDAEGRFLEGPLYYSSEGRECTYVAQDFLKLDSVWHEKALEDSLLTNDCIGHAVNYGVRGPLFINREQLQRLASIRGKLKKSKSSANKLRGGLSVSIFKDFLIHGNTSYSLQHVVNFSLAKQ